MKNFKGKLKHNLIRDEYGILRTASNECVPNHLSYRGTKGNETVKYDLITIAKQKDRSLNYVVEQALLQYIKRNKK